MPVPHTAVCHVLPPPLSWDWVIESLGVKPVTDRSWHNMSIIKACPWCPCDPVLAKGFPGQQGPAAFLPHKLVEVVLLFTSFNVLVWSSLGHLKVSLQPILEKLSLRVCTIPAKPYSQTSKLTINICRSWSQMNKYNDHLQFLFILKVKLIFALLMVLGTSTRKRA